VETHELGETENHGGGDTALAANFVDVMRGEAASISPIENGLLSCLQCLKATESAATHRFEEIEFPKSDTGADAVPEQRSRSDADINQTYWKPLPG
jgi:hypothetical protein